jgi:methylated-DNA-[protein]-cysteine S-methyltransferase
LSGGPPGNLKTHPLLSTARDQLNAYFDGSLHSFDLPLAPLGSEFQQQVWAEMARIPYGQIRTDGDIATAIGSHPRPVGGACGSNPIAVILPCHRVVGNDGQLTGYPGGQGVMTKQQLLRLEGVEPSQMSFSGL